MADRIAVRGDTDLVTTVDASGVVTLRRPDRVSVLAGGFGFDADPVEEPPPDPEPELDPDTVAFLTAAAISDPTITTAVDGLVVALKTAGLWSKLRAVWPMVGGTGASHKFNLKDPRDLHAAHRLTYHINTAADLYDAGNLMPVVHTASGLHPTLGGGYADTHLNPSLHLGSPASTTLAYYSTADSFGGAPANDYTEMGCYDAATGKRFHLIIRYDGNTFYFGQHETTVTGASNADARGLFVGTRLTEADTVNRQVGYKNGVRLTATAGSATAPVQPAFDRSVWIGGINSYDGHTDRPCGFAAIGDGLTQAENADLYAAVQAFQTTLGRQV